MPKRKQPSIPGSRQILPADLHLLDRFTEKDLETWKARSADLDELHQRLYFATEPARINRRAELIAALNAKPPMRHSFDAAVRIVAHQWSDTPMSAIGSLKSFGGRFNIGNDVEHSIPSPFPALYIGEDFETAYREYHQIGKNSNRDGLTPEELSLGGSITSVRIRGHIERVLDVTDPTSIGPVCRVLAKIAMPEGIGRLLRKLRAAPDAVRMIRTPAQLRDAMLVQNWRAWPIQFGVPSPSQQFAELVIAAGYEAIRYRSTKGTGGYCLAVFPSNLQSDATFAELMDPSPGGLEARRLDLQSAESLCGWECLPKSRRPVR